MGNPPGAAWTGPNRLADLPGPMTDEEGAAILAFGRRTEADIKKVDPAARRCGYTTTGVRWRDRHGRIVCLSWETLRRLVDGRRPIPASSRRPATVDRAQRSRREAHGRCDRQNAPPDKEADLSGLSALARAVEVYRRVLRDGPRRISVVRAAIQAAGLSPDSGTDKRARRALRVESRPDGWQGEHILGLPAEPFPPLRDGGIVTRSARGDVDADHRRRHRAAVRAARQRVREVHALRLRVTGTTVGGAR